MGTVKTEIAQAIKTLKLKQEDICLVSDVKSLYLELLVHFVKSGDRRWWWEDFKQEAFYFKEYEFPFQQIINIIPKNVDTVWLMVEDDEEKYYPIYNCKPSVIAQLIGECTAFEYYVIDKNKQWLLCENHSDQLIGVGEQLRIINKDKLR
ncbi:DUF6756 family protein [Aquimarina sp. 2201CG14-23]|uniref:DUF6756 family protein n=1 Tax=Aquimarina mycalae TaxID=3040073 RepID=UPI002477E2C4|nr:DUF6756 family protein [Aquimarina sp. 2201CG14-23]MDH7447590.1 hypothetical protein [Aquimarina sp. 2201CG14-23]